jgi:CheY-like chemotaxis protein
MSKPLHILIVEDSEDDAELLINQIERSGYNPTFQRVDNSVAMAKALEQAMGRCTCRLQFAPV